MIGHICLFFAYKVSDVVTAVYERLLALLQYETLL